MFGKMIEFEIGDATIKVFMPCLPNTAEEDLIKSAKQTIFAILEEDGV